MPDQVHLLLVGTSHRHAPIAVREQLAAQDSRQRLIEAVIAEDAVIEAVGLSTCNRCELYMVGADPEAMREAALSAAGRLRAPQRRARSSRCCTCARAATSAEHLFEVAGGLDSLVPGEAQILAQIRESYAARAGDGIDRHGLQPAVPRGARGRQARPQRDGDRPLERVGGVRRRRAGARAAGRPAAAPAC